MSHYMSNFKMSLSHVIVNRNRFELFKNSKVGVDLEKLTVIPKNNGAQSRGEIIANHGKFRFKNDGDHYIFFTNRD